MSQSFSLSVFPPTINVSVELAALSPEQKRDLIFELLRATDVAYVPELRQQITDISEVLNFSVDPVNTPVPSVMRRGTLQIREVKPLIGGTQAASHVGQKVRLYSAKFETTYEGTIGRETDGGSGTRRLFVAHSLGLATIRPEDEFELI